MVPIGLIWGKLCPVLIPPESSCLAAPGFQKKSNRQAEEENVECRLLLIYQFNQNLVTDARKMLNKCNYCEMRSEGVLFLTGTVTSSTPCRGGGNDASSKCIPSSNAYSWQWGVLQENRDDYRATPGFFRQTRVFSGDHHSAHFRPEFRHHNRVLRQ